MLRQKTETIDGPKVKFPVEKPQEKELWVSGLKKIITHNNKLGYEIGVYHCPRCKEELAVNKKLQGLEKFCPKCGKQMMIKDVMRQKVVKDIVSRQVAYVCPSCGKVYRWPVKCCVAKQKLTPAEMLEFNVGRF